ncbi:hypothetical protein EJ02DRAFT_465104 [Clathrospora elynae]|uniref:Uncharacterized protein n=1 Tax=Clathrospora elynae TaxID=706981 RepID=A0A6A5SSV3_9PLEO|nr:hypothetical protein EJ02DRAFT_465104 [Clathrospora elynae]
MAPKRLRQLTPASSDGDGDSAMHSSPGNASDDEMFPDEALPNNPATPHNANLNLASNSNELSPPNSQTQSRDPSSLALGVNSNGKRPLSTGMTQLATNLPEGEGVHRDAETGYQWSMQEDQPGFAWKNARVREEEARAWDSIVDKEHMVKLTYGDPLDASVAPKMKR